MENKKLAELNQFIETADLALQQAREVLIELGADKVSDKLARSRARSLVAVEDNNEATAEKIIEGVFNGQNMIGPDGKEYSMPANYASKSKLVEGDILKLTIQADGSFLYKQINPIARERLTGKLLVDEVTGQYAALAKNGKKYNLLTASVTYFKGEPGDEVIILIPKDKVCQWAAVENIIKGLAEEKNYDDLTSSAVSEPILSFSHDSEEKENEDENTPAENNSNAEKEEIEKLINEDGPTPQPISLIKDDLDKDDLEEI